MKKHIQEAYNLCEGFSSQDIETLISALKNLNEDVKEGELYASFAKSYQYDKPLSQLSGATGVATV